jgi:hypothetical protein
MTQNQALTYGAVAFAAFTLFYVFKKTPAKAIATQPGQQQRDADLSAWLGVMDQQLASVSLSSSLDQYRPLTAGLGI